MPPDPDPLPPVLAGRYRLGERLGSGGMADVWAAVDERLHRPVAVKVLRTDPGATVEEDEVGRRRFTQEGRTVAALVDASIVAIHDAGDDGAHAFLVMERLPGSTLRDRLAGGPLSDDEARSVLLDVLAALEVAHRAGVVHRDIKPANVLAAADGSWKVADFGIAKAVDVETGDLTVAGQLVGTPRFTAPERFAGQPATAASDIYSAGVVLREVLAGRTDVAADLGAVVARATAPDPARRFSSAHSMADALTSGGGVPTVPLVAPVPGEDEPTVAQTEQPTQVSHPEPATVLASGPRTARSGWVAAGVAVAAALLVVGGIALATTSDDGSGGTPVPSSTTVVVATTAAPAVSLATTTAPAVSVAEEPAASTVPAPSTAPDKGKGKDKPPKGKG